MLGLAALAGIDVIINPLAPPGRPVWIRSLNKIYAFDFEDVVLFVERINWRWFLRQQYEAALEDYERIIRAAEERLGLR